MVTQKFNKTFHRVAKMSLICDYFSDLVNVMTRVILFLTTSGRGECRAHVRATVQGQSVRRSSSETNSAVRGAKG